jgi:hypothetical protein
MVINSSCRLTVCSDICRKVYFEKNMFKTIGLMDNTLNLYCIHVNLQPQNVDLQPQHWWVLHIHWLQFCNYIAVILLLCIINCKNNVKKCSLYYLNQLGNAQISCTQSGFSKVSTQVWFRAKKQYLNCIIKIILLWNVLLNVHTRHIINHENLWIVSILDY